MAFESGLTSSVGLFSRIEQASAGRSWISLLVFIVVGVGVFVGDEQDEEEEEGLGGGLFAVADC